MARLTGKIAVVTGAGGGMGEAHARCLAAEGARVVLTDIVDQHGPQIAAEIGSSARFVQHDVRDAASWENVLAVTEKEFGPVNVLVNNAAIVRSVSVAECTPALYREIIEVNQVGAFIGLKAVIEPMRAAQGGSIINISSIGGIVGSANAIGYCDAKFALRGMTKVAAIELGRHNIRVNTVHPGPIATRLLLEHPDFARYEEEARKTPLARLGSPEEVSRLVVFLASDESSFSTGCEFVADGGMTAQ
jgi:3alpha(or 20beta)-hydroxysteroid dehydrogenase